MNLTKEQLELLKIEIEKLEVEIANLEKDASENYAIRLAKTAELKELNKMILESVTLSINTNESIGLGSRFNAVIYCLSDEGEAYDFLISETHIRVPGYTVVTPNTPFGEAVIGKKENDEFSYVANGNTINVKVKEIYKENTKETAKELTKDKTLVK